MVPQAQIIAEPLANMLTRPSKRRARDHEGPLARTANKERVARCHGHHLAVDIMRIVLDEPVDVF
jgi:hypothetical protein